MHEREDIEVGANRTGIAVARERAEQMLSGAEDLLPTGSSDPGRLAELREPYFGSGLGTVPPPTSFRALAKTAMKKIAGAQPMSFMDKLGERLAFEKGGVRLYQALIAKLDARGGFAGGPSRVELSELLEEEAEHQEMLISVIESLSGDPTAVTPSADVSAVLSAGVFAVIADPRSSVLQSLEAILLAELADNEGWDTLVAFAELAGERAYRETFAQARADEALHLERVREWIARGQGRARITAAPKTRAPRARTVTRQRKRPTKKKAARKTKARRARVRAR